jgi:hypothetical protein
MIPVNTAMAQKYASQMMKKVTGEAMRLAPWGAPAGKYSIGREKVGMKRAHRKWVGRRRFQPSYMPRNFAV